MATLLSRVSRAIMAEEYPRDRVFWFLEMVALGFVLEAVGALFRGQFAVMITAIVSGGVFGLVAFHWKEIRWVAASVVALASIATSFLWWSNHRPGLVVLYAESPLNGKTVRLIVPTDRTLEIHQMVAWPPEAPTSFSVLGIALRNNADADLQPDIAWISFNAPIQQWRPNTAGWRRSLDVSADGWMSYRHDFPRGKIEPDTAVYLDAFQGTPIPDKPVKVRLTLSWASKTTTAEFTLMPPSAQTQAR